MKICLLMMLIGTLLTAICFTSVPEQQSKNASTIADCSKLKRLAQASGPPPAAILTLTTKKSRQDRGGADLSPRADVSADRYCASECSAAHRPFSFAR